MPHLYGYETRLYIVIPSASKRKRISTSAMQVKGCCDETLGESGTTLPHIGAKINAILKER